MKSEGSTGNRGAKFGSASHSKRSDHMEVGKMVKPGKAKGASPSKTKTGNTGY